MGPPANPPIHNNPHAHRKLFPPIDNNSHSNNDMVLLNGNQIESNYNQSQSAHHLSHQQQHHFQQSVQQQDQQLEPNRQAPADLANIAHLKRSDSYFMSDELRSEIIRKNLLLLAMPSQDMAIRKLKLSTYFNFTSIILN